MTGKKGVVFVVDDDAAVRDSIGFALGVEGISSRLCSRGADLLAHPDLRAARCIVLDCEMDAMDGFSVLDRLAAEAVNIPVVFMTTHLTSSLKRRAESAGVFQVVEKPFFNGSLLESIRTACSKKAMTASVGACHL